MALLLLDAATTTTNFLPNQSNSLFFILPQECFHKVTLPKASPMLSTRPSHSRRRPVIPQPSPSQIAMQKKGLELTLKSRETSPNHDHLFEDSRITTPDSAKDQSIESGNVRVERTSSVYSTESAHSTDSTETTISQIVEMYTDLINKIPRFELSDINILQPRAYRDTVAPLLQRRFSADNQSSSFPSSVSTTMSRSMNKLNETSTEISHLKAPGFLKLSSSLRGRRAEMVSPMSAASSDYARQPLDDVSESPPATPRMRPFSFVSDTQANIKDERPISPLTTTNGSRTLVPASEPVIEDVTPLSSESEEPARQCRPSKSIRYVRSKDIFEAGQQSQTEKSGEAPQTLVHQDSGRFYRNRSTGSASTDSFVIYTGLGETFKAMIKEKMNRRKEAKEKAKIITAASQKYPIIKQEMRKQSKERRRSSIINGVNSVLRNPSTKESACDTASSSPAKGKMTAIPLTPYQKYGAEAWTVKNKKKRKEERQREREAQLAKEVSVSPKQEHKHKRTASSKTTSTIASNASHEKKNGLVAALHGARNSLTYTSAEKRREKLKESIVLVGPVQLTYTNASASGGTSV